MGCNCSSNNHESCIEVKYPTQTLSHKNDDDYDNEIEKENEERKKLIEKLSLQGVFLEKSIKEILDEINPEINLFNISKELSERENIIELPLIKMNNGDIYEGGWNINGEKEGFGIFIYNNKQVYKGFWKENNFDEYGLLFNNAYNYYIGQIENGIAKGKGELLINNKVKYISDFDNNLPNGKGEIKYLDEEINYKGDIINGNKNGFGILEFKDGTKYEGEFKEDKYNGKGKIIYADGSEYEGNFNNNLKEGNGVYKWGDGKIYEGEFKNNIKNGKGKLIFNKNEFYEGNWINDLPHGKGIYSINGKNYIGIFKYGKIIFEKNENL